MSANAHRRAAAQAQAEQTHAADTAAAETAELANAMGEPDAHGEPDRQTISLGNLTELMQELPDLNALLGAETVARLKASGPDMWKASLGMASYDLGRRNLAYEYQGKVIVRQMGRFLQSQARGMLTQAFYALRNAVREHARWRLLDQSLRLARQTDYLRTRPGQEEDGVSEAPWIDGDDSFDPSKRQADRAAEALMEALPFVAAAYIFCQRVPGMTDDEPVTASVRKAQTQEAKARPQTMADRMRAAPAGTIAEFLDSAA